MPSRWSCSNVRIEVNSKSPNPERDRGHIPNSSLRYRMIGLTAPRSASSPETTSFVLFASRCFFFVCHIHDGLRVILQHSNHVDRWPHWTSGSQSKALAVNATGSAAVHRGSSTIMRQLSNSTSVEFRDRLHFSPGSLSLRTTELCLATMVRGSDEDSTRSLLWMELGTVPDSINDPGFAFPVKSVALTSPP